MSRSDNKSKLETNKLIKEYLEQDKQDEYGLQVVSDRCYSEDVIEAVMKELIHIKRVYKLDTLNIKDSMDDITSDIVESYYNR